MMPKILSNKLLVVNIISVIALLGAVGTAIFFYGQYQRSIAIKNQPAAEIETTAAAVSRLIELPNESPTLATVSDVDKLKDQDFFRRAQNGDKVLIFKDAKKAILYRPFTNKIIEVGPIQVDTPEQKVAGVATASAQVASPSPVSVSPTVTITPQAEAISVVVYNGTKVTGLSKKTADQISKEFSDIKIKTTGNAVGTYEKTIVIDISTTHKAKASSLATYLKGTVATLPKGETAPNADILIILGRK